MSRSSTPIWLPVDKWSDEPKRDSKKARHALRLVTREESGPCFPVDVEVNKDTTRG